MKIEDLKRLCNEATPGPWKYDCGNWEVEGPRPDRYAICAMDPASRKPPFHGQRPNPIDSMADGDFIAAARTALPKLIAVAEAAKQYFIDEDGGCRDCNTGKIKDALTALESE